ncbi:hypothetical protein CANARDRAFT_28426 [[Candida] arabinofermentans NRRL YB-2248]|uniref:G-patch domain-containing protein n=1 Tax=[Candida] arabinofermentans NRRL YB-2248 TaxID=983967 RepID=A0A1E4T033_9ASCO|nr:hypothetical protein CANARDRAFT_28426 [[Candida] arabinofermentans NRRL YB-2248]
MDTRGYLKRHGWKEGEALKKGGLKKPILVKHKRDLKGLGHDADQAEAWWERVFDGQLKALNVSVSDGSSTTGAQTQGALLFKQDRSTATGLSAHASPLYRMFVRGEGLAGTIDNENSPKTAEKNAVVKVVEMEIANSFKANAADDQLMLFELSSDEESDEESDSDEEKSTKQKLSEEKKAKKIKKAKKQKKEKKEKKAKKSKKISKSDGDISISKKSTKEGSLKKDKKSKKDKKNKEEKKHKSSESREDKKRKRSDNELIEKKTIKEEKVSKKTAGEKKRKQTSDDASENPKKLKKTKK